MYKLYKNGAGEVTWGYYSDYSHEEKSTSFCIIPPTIYEWFHSFTYYRIYLKTF